MIAGRIPGRTDNEIKNFWNTHLSKKLINKGIDPRTHKPFDIANPKPNSNEHPSWSVLPHNPNPNPNHHSCFEERSESRKHECNSQTPPAEDIDDRRGNARVNSSEGLKEKSDHDDQNQENINEIDPMNINSCNEDAIFSSFLDSLIDENNEFANQVQMLQSNVVVDDHDQPAVLPFSSTSTVWDDELAYAMETLSHAEENMAIVFDNHPLVSS